MGNSMWKEAIAQDDKAIEERLERVRKGLRVCGVKDHTYPFTRECLLDPDHTGDHMDHGYAKSLVATWER